MTRVFLTAEWRNLAIVNYVVPSALLQPLVPRGTSLDAFEGRTYLSLVGFMFARTRLLGVPIPFHTDFEEVNLRFYVRREVDGEIRRAVTFIRELVPRPAIAFVARMAYNEPYAALPMRHRADSASVEYGWKMAGGWSTLRVEADAADEPIAPRSEAEFIAEHYWGYTRQRDGSTMEYRVDHPRWRVRPVRLASVSGEHASLYGPDFARVLAQPPDSAFLALGSAVTVYAPERLPD